MRIVQEMAKLISLMEGWKANSQSWQFNNPGNLRYGPRQAGTSVNGFALYNTLADGWADLEALIEGTIRKHPNLTFETFFQGERDATGKVIPGGYPGYAPAADSNNPNVYAKFVATGCHLSPDEVLAGKLA